MSSFESLPDRPLTIDEADQLTNSGKFVPLSIKSKLANEIPYTDTPEKDIAENSVYFVYSLLYATEERAVSIAYSETHSQWMKAVEKNDPENYDSQEVEEETHQFVMEHNEVEIDAGLVDMEADDE